jgi:hypothetical protein
MTTVLLALFIWAAMSLSIGYLVAYYTFRRPPHRPTAQRCERTPHGYRYHTYRRR